MTPAVAEEAINSPTSFIVSYHPTIFKPLSSFTLSNPLQSSLLRCAAAGISVYSPHTSLDSVHGGINDWLASGLVPPPQRGEISILGEDLEGGLGGQGRLVTLPEPITMGEIERRIKEHLALKHSPYPFHCRHHHHHLLLLLSSSLFLSFKKIKYKNRGNQDCLIPF